MKLISENLTRLLELLELVYYIFSREPAKKQIMHLKLVILGELYHCSCYY